MPQGDRNKEGHEVLSCGRVFEARLAVHARRPRVCRGSGAHPRPSGGPQLFCPGARRAERAVATPWRCHGLSPQPSWLVAPGPARRGSWRALWQRAVSAVGTRVRRVFPSPVGEGGCGHAGPASPRGPGPFRSTVLSVSPRCAQAEDTEGEGRGLHPLSLNQGAARCHRRHAPAASPGPGCGAGIRQRGLGSVHRAVNAGGNGAFVAEEAGVEWPLAVPGTSLDEQRKCPLSVPFSS